MAEIVVVVRGNQAQSAKNLQPKSSSLFIYIFEQLVTSLKLIRALILKAFNLPFHQNQWESPGGGGGRDDIFRIKIHMSLHIYFLSSMVEYWLLLNSLRKQQGRAVFNNISLKLPLIQRTPPKDDYSTSPGTVRVRLCYSNCDALKSVSEISVTKSTPVLKKDF